jgi:hypothetical protein
MNSSELTPNLRSQRRRTIPQRYQDNGHDSNDDEIIQQISSNGRTSSSVRRVRRRISHEFEVDVVQEQRQNEDLQHNADFSNIREELDRIIANQVVRVYNNNIPIERTAAVIYNEVSDRRTFRRIYGSTNFPYLMVGRRGDVSNFNEQSSNILDNYCGNMNNKCLYCGARFFNPERNTAGDYNNCCFKGKFCLPSMSPPTEFMQELFKGTTRQSKLFLKHPRFYNNHLSFASITMDEGKVLEEFSKIY